MLHCAFGDDFQLMSLQCPVHDMLYLSLVDCRCQMLHCLGSSFANIGGAGERALSFRLPVADEYPVPKQTMAMYSASRVPLSWAIPLYNRNSVPAAVQISLIFPLFQAQMKYPLRSRVHRLAWSICLFWQALSINSKRFGLQQCLDLCCAKWGPVGAPY